MFALRNLEKVNGRATFNHGNLHLLRCITGHKGAHPEAQQVRFPTLTIAQNEKVWSHREEIYIDRLQTELFKSQ